MDNQTIYEDEYGDKLVIFTGATRGNVRLKVVGRNDDGADVSDVWLSPEQVKDLRANLKALARIEKDARGYR